MVVLTCEAVDDTAQVCGACFGIRNMPRRVGQAPRFEYPREQRGPKRLLVDLLFFRYNSNQKSTGLMGDTLFNQSDVNET